VEETKMAYVDGFLVAVPTANIEAYKKLASAAGAVWKEHGALNYVECLADDVPYGELTSFPRAVRQRTTRPSSSRGSSTGRVRTGTRSSPR
jgi:uncharacterized protein YbaA (DUF1428 family)